MSGDATISSAGALTIASGAVETAMIAADAITGAKIADDSIGSEHIEVLEAENYDLKQEIIILKKRLQYYKSVNENPTDETDG